ncbi:MAG: hypothetical protein SF028_09015 [Candidatus Sumerlaeia bacterium]|nr:hypothetical protein [Candidatus Sumerlaeia bacterium]
MRRCVGLPLAVRSIRRAVPLWLLLFAVPPFLLLWVAGAAVAEGWIGATGGGAFLVHLGTLTAYALLMAAFVAPAAGVGARYMIDRTALFHHSALTPLRAVDYAEAVRARVLVSTLIAFLVAAAAALGIGWHLHCANPGHFGSIRSSELGLLIDFVPPLRVGLGTRQPDWDGRLLYALLACMVVAFTASAHARAMLNAAIRPHGAAPVFGTVFLVFGTMVLFVLRFKLLTSASITTLLLPGAPNAYMALFILTEVVMAALWISAAKVAEALTANSIAGSLSGDRG